MTAESVRGGQAGERLLAEMIAMLQKVTGENPEWAGGITRATRLEGDLYLDSLEMAALCDLVREAYGDRADLAAFVAGLDIDQIIALTVGDLVAQVAAARVAGFPPPRSADAGAGR